MKEAWTLEARLEVILAVNLINLYKPDIEGKRWFLYTDGCLLYAQYAKVGKGIYIQLIPGLCSHRIGS